MVILETRDLKKQYGTGETAVHALAGVNLSVENGEFVAVVGTSGSGKSTLLHMLGGLDRATSGKVYVDGKDIFALKDEELTIFRRRKIGFVFQSFNLVPVLSVYENIVLPLQLDGKTVDNAFIGEIAEALGLKEKLNVLPNQLSGGQQQRVAIARALAAKPAILLADDTGKKPCLCAHHCRAQSAGFQNEKPDCRDCNYADHDAVYRAVYDCNFHQRFVPAVQLSYGRRRCARVF